MDLKTNFKTPISILTEVCAKFDTQAIFLEGFEDSPGESSGVEGRFKCKVTFEDYTTYGGGQTKKEAKQNCAKAMVSLLEVTDEKYKDVIRRLCLRDGTIPEAPLTERNKAPKDSVLALCHLCMSKNLNPVYELIAEQGPAHAKLFTMSCSVSHMKYVASATTKKASKQLAASMMLKYFNDETSIESPDKKENSNFNLDDYGSFEINNDLHNAFNIESKTLKELENNHDNENSLMEELKTKNAYGLLVDILTESGFSHTVQRYPSKKGKVLVGISVDTEMPLSFMIIGDSYEESLQNTSIDAICALFTLNFKDAHKLKYLTL